MVARYLFFRVWWLTDTARIDAYVYSTVVHETTCIHVRNVSYYTDRRQINYLQGIFLLDNEFWHVQP